MDAAMTDQLREVSAAYDRWIESTKSGEDHYTINAKWESYLALRDHANVCGYEDPFGGPCLLPKNHANRTHDDGRRPVSSFPPRRSRTAGCAYCDSHAPGSMMPPHDASPRCESGKRTHCTCDVCF